MNLCGLSKEELLKLTELYIKENTELKIKLSLQSNKILFSDFILNWLEKKKPFWQETTYMGYYNIVSKHIVPYFKKLNICVEDLIYEDIEKYYIYLLDKGLTPNTIRKHHSNIRKCLNEAVKQKRVSNNQAHLVELPRITKRPVHYYQIDDLIKLFALTKFDVIYPVVLFTALGLRRSEALGIKWGDIDLKNRTLTISRKIVPIEGNPAKETDILKNSSSYRTIVLPEFYIDELKTLYKNQIKEYIKSRKMLSLFQHEYVCVNENGKVIKPSLATHRLKDTFIDKYKLKPITFKGLRHTCATLINCEGFNLKYAQEWLGHSTIAITADTYSHIDLSQKYKVAKSLHIGILDKIAK